jgi:hypothetical protein
VDKGEAEAVHDHDKLEHARALGGGKSPSRRHAFDSQINLSNGNDYHES